MITTEHMSLSSKPDDRRKSTLIKQIGDRLFAGLRKQPATTESGATDPWNIHEWQFPYESARRDQLLFLVNFAVLAPSVLNRQPWQFKIVDDRLLLYADTDKVLPSFDPKRREMTMSCGAALFHIRTAARHYGFVPFVRTFPTMDDPELLAELTLGPVRAPTTLDEQLFMAIRKRRTHRKSFKNKPVEEVARIGLANAVRIEGAELSFVEGDDRVRMAAIIREAQERLDRDEAYQAEVDASNIPAVGSVEDTPIISHRDKSVESIDERSPATSAPALALLSTSADTVPSWLAAGQAVDRLLLTAREYGLFASFMNQPMHFVDTRQALAEFAGEAAPQLILRIGYGTAPPPTPRSAASVAAE